MKRVTVILLAVAVFSVWSTPIRACPLCSEETEAQSQANAESPDLAAGFSYSVLFMLAVPYSMLAGFGYVIYRNHRASMIAQTDKDSHGAEHRR